MVRTFLVSLEMQRNLPNLGGFEKLTKFIIKMTDFNVLSHVVAMATDFLQNLPKI